MTIFYCYITENKRSRRYFIETAEGGTVAWFDELDTAALVLRYLTGADMTPEDVAAAHAAMKKFDAGKEGDND